MKTILNIITRFLAWLFCCSLFQCRYDRDKLIDESHKTVNSGLVLDSFALELTNRYNTAYQITSSNKLNIIFILQKNYLAEYFVDVEVKNGKVDSIDLDNAIMNIHKISKIRPESNGASFSGTRVLTRKEMIILQNNNFDFTILGLKNDVVPVPNVDKYFDNKASSMRK